MEDELSNFIKVWLSIWVSLSYCYLITKVVSKGIKRLLCFLPIVFLFLLVPLKFNSVNFGGGTAFFISWLANFKLFLLAFERDPLASPNPSKSPSFSLFIAVACLPIELKRHPSHQTTEKSTKRHLIRILLLVLLLRVLDHKRHFHHGVVLALYCILIYLLLETILAAAAALARALFGLQLEPQFDEPYLSTSLQDFWGRRWNLMVTRVLRPTVYEPVLGFVSPLMGRKWASIPAVNATFIVSGLVHELIYYYLGRVPPTWEVTSFFVLHGLCLTVEITLKKALGDTWRIPRVVSAVLTIGFVMLTSFWLFFPQFLRCEADVRLLREFAIFGDFLRNLF